MNWTYYNVRRQKTSTIKATQIYWNHLSSLMQMPASEGSASISPSRRHRCLSILWWSSSIGSTENHSGYLKSARYMPVGRGTLPGCATTLTLPAHTSWGPSPRKGIRSSCSINSYLQRGQCGSPFCTFSSGHKQAQQYKWPQIVMTPPRTSSWHRLHMKAASKWFASRQRCSIRRLGRDSTMKKRWKSYIVQ